MQITTIGLDLAKNAFQVHGIDAAGQAVVRKSLRRAQMLPFFAKLPPCLVGIDVRHVASLGSRADQARS
jgi:transposase